MPSKSDLRQRQALPLGAKVLMSQARIREWYNHFNGDVYVSFSGGKDSTVLAHLVHDIYPDVPLVFSNTGLEYPEIQLFARKMGAIFVRPRMPFNDVISKYGYPIISKEVAEAIATARKMRTGYGDMRRADLMGKRAEYDGGKYGNDSMFNKKKWLALSQGTQFKIASTCCKVMKKGPLHTYERNEKRAPYIGMLAEESRVREQAWIKHGCNAFDAAKKTSNPMSFWTEQDVLQYIKQECLEIASVYGDIVAVGPDGYEYEPLPGMDCKLKCSGCQRTGCIFCGFGQHLAKETSFSLLAKTHPKQYDYCMLGGQWVDNPDYDGNAPKYNGEWLNWNPKKIWVPSKKGLGMKKVFDDCNQIYGKDFIKYD